MSIDNLAKAERNAFNSDLAKENNLEAESTARSIRIEEIVAEMTKEGNAFYPFLPANFHEAICQMSDDKVNEIGSYVMLSVKSDMDFAKRDLTDELITIAKEYWENTARVIIERDKLVD